MDILSFFSTIEGFITLLVTNVVTWAGTFLFFKQRKEGMEIENESKQSAEWRKLYLDQKQDSKEKDSKIDRLTERLNEYGLKVVRIEALLDSVGCMRRGCPDRLHISASESHTPCIPEQFQPKPYNFQQAQEQEADYQPEQEAADQESDSDLDAYNL